MYEKIVGLSHWQYKKIKAGALIPGNFFAINKRLIHNQCLSAEEELSLGIPLMSS